MHTTYPNSGSLPHSLVCPLSLRGVLPWAFLLLYCGFLFFLGLGDRDLLSSHEARAAQNGQMIVSDGCWGLPRLFDRHLEMQKPPMYYWLVALFGHLLGGQVDAWAVRLPAALAALGCVLFVYYLGRKSGRAGAGFLAALILATCVHFTWLARIGRIDMPLTLTVTLAAGSFHLGMLAAVRDPPQLAWPWYLLGYVSVALGILLKGPIALVLAGVIGGTFALAQWRQQRHGFPPLPLYSGGEGRGEGVVASFAKISGLCKDAPTPSPPPPLPLSTAGEGRKRETCQTQKTCRPTIGPGASLYWGLPLVILIAAPWFLWANWETNNQIWEVFFYYHNIERGLGGSDTLASHPFWFYLPRAFVDLLPWSLAIPPAAWYFFRRGGWSHDREARLGAVWFLAVFGLLSCMRFKRADYLLPAYPGAALFLGCMGERCLSFSVRRGARTLNSKLIILLSLLVACYALGWGTYNLWAVSREDQGWPYYDLARDIRAHTDKPVIFFRAESHVLAFHVGRPLDTILEWENLDIWASQSFPVYFIMPPDCAAAWPQHLIKGRLEEVFRTSEHPWGKRERPLVVMRSCP